MPLYRQVEEIKRLVNEPKVVRNVSIIAHVDHGKTTLSDSLLAAAGIISTKKAGQDLKLDTDPLEKGRKMTIYASNVSMVHIFKGNEYLINLIDTPGHIDFTAAVTRSLRAVDGALVVVDAVKGPRTQTETVLRQALVERVKPILFLNKVDTLIRVMQLDPEDIQRKFAKIILKVNKLVEKYAPVEHKQDWKVSVEDGRVAFGSALHKWGLNLPSMKAKGITFKDVVGAYTGEPEEVKRKVDELSEKSPLYEPILDMFCEHLPSPLQSQSYRQSQIWPGDTESQVGKAIAKVDPNGPLLMCVTSIKVEKESGVVVAIGRVFSGTVEKGKKVWLVTGQRKGTIQQTYMIMVEDKLPMEKIPAGNMAALSGLPTIHIGETIAEENAVVQPFEELKYVSDPVVTVAIVPENESDTKDFIKLMHRLTIEDSSLRFITNSETGEYLLSGMGKLHLEIAVHKIEKELKVKISNPTVIYRETISHDYSGPAIMGKSANKHNKLWITLEKLSDDVIEAIGTRKISEMQPLEERQRMLRDLGWSARDAREVIAIEGNNLLVNRIKGRQHVEEILDSVESGFREAVFASALAKEPAYGLKVNLGDAIIHEDPVHRGTAQILPMTRRAIWCAFLLSEPKLLEPLIHLECNTPNEFVGNIISIVQRHRGRILGSSREDASDEEDTTTIEAEIPLAETFDIADEIRSSTQGRVFSLDTQFCRWAPVPETIQPDVIRQIRTKKGLNTVPPKAEEFSEVQ